MTDSKKTDSKDHKREELIATLIADCEAAEAEQRRIEEEEEAKRSILRGNLTQDILNLDADDLNKVALFIRKGCDFEEVVVDNDNSELRSELVELKRDNAELRKENERLSHLDNSYILSFPEEGEFKKAKDILALCVNGGGRLIDPTRVKNALKPKPRDTGETKGLSRPPMTPQSKSADEDKDEPNSEPNRKSLLDRVLGK